MPGTDSSVQERLQRAAAELLLERGADVTAGQIAARAGVTERTFFRYFPDKRAVFFRTEDALLREMERVVLQQAPGTGPVEAALSAMRLVTLGIDEHPDDVLRRAIVIYGAPELLQYRNTVLDEWGELIERALQRAGHGWREAHAAARVAGALFRAAYDIWMVERRSGGTESLTERLGRLIEGRWITEDQAVLGDARDWAAWKPQPAVPTPSEDRSSQAAVDTGRVAAAAAELRRRIFSGELAVGRPLREIQLAAALQVGRNTLRAAMQDLVADGLLRHERHRGTEVPSLGPDDVDDLLGARIAIESEAARQAAERRRVPGDAVAAQRDGWMSGRVDTVEEDLRFHLALVEAASSPRLTLAYRPLEAQLRLLAAQSRSSLLDQDRYAAEHEAVLRAISRGDADAAATAVRAHLQPRVLDTA